MSVALKRQDVMLALKLVALGDASWTYAQLAESLGMSASEVHQAARRLEVCGLLSPARRSVNRGALRDFLVHGIAHVFPAAVGRETTGMPTAGSAAPLSGRLLAGDDARTVWPSPHGKVRGAGVEPLYPSAPDAAARDGALYGLLTLTDALRIGRARERALAAAELERRLR